ncbi:MAG: DUF5678 domain-containing protein [Candidatus Omnitrophota bacterium]
MEKMIDRTDIFKKYQGQWIALTEDDKVISAAPTLDEVLEKAKKKGFENPVISRIPDLKYDYVL